MKITLRKLGNNWGNTYYKRVCETGKLLVSLTKNQNFTRETLDIVRQLGYSFELEKQEIDF